MDEKTFTQAELNEIIGERLSREREKIESDIKKRESRLDCRDYLSGKKYPAELLDILDTTDIESFKGYEK